ncbi:hypothetical protein [Actinophytocola oryzae]|uniref:hypothetical protein n=1 Tax=Actinophytocola oryzae TaxID=502181 RepID=UPI0010626FAB|nr:hypothetical protein [Actinophytocola oryzae]
MTSSTVGVNTTDFLADPLGPATVAGALVQQPGEGRLLWAAYTTAHDVDIPGVTSTLACDETPDLIVWGPARDCLAHRYVRDSSPGRRRLWTLTPQRLALHTEVAAPLPEPSQGASLLAKVAKLGRELAEKVNETRLRFGANVEDEPVALPTLEPLAEIPRSRIAGFEVAHRGDTPVLRLRLVDRSGIDFLVGMTDRDECEYAVGLANGEPSLRPGARAEWVAKLAEKSRKLAERLVRPGEQVLLAGTNNHGYVGVQLGRELRVPHAPLGVMPALNLTKLRWPRPAPTSQNPNGWLDDPTIAFWVQADHAGRDAVALADMLAHTRGVARLVLTRARLALVAATKLLATPPDPGPPMTSVLELPATRIRAVAAEYAGHSLPPKPLLRLDFTDGSTLRLRDPIAARQAALIGR